MSASNPTIIAQPIILGRLLKTGQSFDFDNPFFIAEEALKLVFADIIGDAGNDGIAMQIHPLTPLLDRFHGLVMEMTDPSVESTDKNINLAARRKAALAEHEIMHCVRNEWLERRHSGGWPAPCHRPPGLRPCSSRAGEGSRNATSEPESRRPIWRQIAQVLQKLTKH